MKSEILSAIGKMRITSKDFNFKLYAAVSIVSITIIGVWVLFSIPIIVYHSQQFETVNCHRFYYIYNYYGYYVFIGSI